MFVLLHFVISSIITSLVWLSGTAGLFLLYVGFYQPAKLFALATLFQAPVGVWSGISLLASDPILLTAGIFVAAVIMLYDKFVLFLFLTLIRQDQSRAP